MLPFFLNKKFFAIDKQCEAKYARSKVFFFDILELVLRTQVSTKLVPDMYIIVSKRKSSNKCWIYETPCLDLSKMTTSLALIL